MSSRGLFRLCGLLGALVLAWFAWRGFASLGDERRKAVAAPIVDKRPVVFANHTFDPAALPADMPPLSAGENAECDSDFQSNASVRGETRQIDPSHATLIISQIKVTLELHVNIWVPAGVSQKVVEHEQGHRQISEYYYQTADKIAMRIAASYIGRRVEIIGTDLGGESTKVLQQMAGEINAEYNKELNPGPTQLLYDDITDHGRNETAVQDALAHAIKNVSVESAPSTSNPAN